MSAKRYTLQQVNAIVHDGHADAESWTYAPAQLPQEFSERQIHTEAMYAAGIEGRPYSRVLLRDVVVANDKPSLHQSHWRAC